MKRSSHALATAGGADPREYYSTRERAKTSSIHDHVPICYRQFNCSVSSYCLPSSRTPVHGQLAHLYLQYLVETYSAYLAGSGPRSQVLRASDVRVHSTMTPSPSSTRCHFACGKGFDLVFDILEARVNHDDYLYPPARFRILPRNA
jgi:hypothetical protein